MITTLSDKEYNIAAGEHYIECMYVCVLKIQVYPQRVQNGINSICNICAESCESRECPADVDVDFCWFDTLGRGGGRVCVCVHAESSVERDRRDNIV